MTQARLFVLFIVLCFSSAVFGEEKTLSLEQAIRHSLQHNHQLQTHLRTQELLEHQRLAIASKWYPKSQLRVHADTEHQNEGLFANTSNRLGVSPSLSGQWVTGLQWRLEASHFVNKNTGVHRQNQWRLSVEQPLLKGARPAINRVPERDIELQQEQDQFDYEKLKSQVIQQVISAYAQAYLAFARQELLEHFFENHLHLKQVVLEKIKQGSLADIESIQHEIQSKKYQQMINQAASQVRQTQVALGQVMGSHHPKTYTLSPIQLKTDSHLKKVEYLETAKAKLDQEQFLAGGRIRAQRSVIEDNQLWDLKLQGFIGKGRHSYYHEDASPLSLDEHYHSQSQKYLGLFLTIPIESNAPTKLARAQNRIALQNLQSQYAASSYDLEARLTYAYDQLEYWQNQTLLAHQTRGLTDKSKQVIEQKYLAGFASHLDLENAEQLALQAQYDELSTRVSHLLAYVELQYISRTLGEHWQDYVV